MGNVSASLREARITHSDGDRRQAETLFNEVVAEYEQVTTDDRRADIAHRLAAFCRDINDTVRAETFASAAVIAEKVNGRDALLGNHLMFLAELLRSQGRITEALPLVEEALPCYQRSHGADHRETAYIASCLAQHRKLAAG